VVSIPILRHACWAGRLWPSSELPRLLSLPGGDSLVWAGCCDAGHTRVLFRPRGDGTLQDCTDSEVSLEDLPLMRVAHPEDILLVEQRKAWQELLCSYEVAQPFEQVSYDRPESFRHGDEAHPFHRKGQGTRLDWSFHGPKVGKESRSYRGHSPRCRTCRLEALAREWKDPDQDRHTIVLRYSDPKGSTQVFQICRRQKPGGPPYYFRTGPCKYASQSDWRTLPPTDVKPGRLVGITFLEREAIRRALAVNRRWAKANPEAFEKWKACCQKRRQQKVRAKVGQVIPPDFTIEEEAA